MTDFLFYLVFRPLSPVFSSSDHMLMTANINLYSHCCWICLQRVLRTFIYFFLGGWGGVHKGVSFLLVWFEPKPGSDLFVRLIKLLEQIPPQIQLVKYILDPGRSVNHVVEKKHLNQKGDSCLVHVWLSLLVQALYAIWVRLDSRCLFYKMKTLASPNLKKSYLPAHMFLPSAFKTAWVQLIILGLFL